MFQQLFRNIPDVTKNLLIINLLMFLASVLLQVKGIDLVTTFGMHYPGSPLFEPFQLATHMFMHGGLLHIFFNMFALVIFGSRLEMVWGPKRYLLFYFLTAFGAIGLHLLVSYFRFEDIMSSFSADEAKYYKEIISTKGAELIESGRNFQDPILGELNGIYNGSLVGASGAIFGILIGFAMLFPNTELMLMFIPIPIKAKYLVGFYVLAEIYLGWQNNPHDNIAHFAHLGGALIGAIMVWIWKRDRKNFF